MPQPPLRADGSIGQNCAACDKLDSFDEFVQCSECAKWCHQGCAGIDIIETSAEDTFLWTCKPCQDEKGLDPSLSAAELVLSLSSLLDSSNLGAAVQPEIVDKIKATAAQLNQVLNQKSSNVIATTCAPQPSPSTRVQTRTVTTKSQPSLVRQSTSVGHSGMLNNTFPNTSNARNSSFSETNTYRMRRLEIIRKMHALAAEEKELLDSLDEEGSSFPSSQPCITVPPFIAPTYTNLCSVTASHSPIVSSISTNTATAPSYLSSLLHTPPYPNRYLGHPTTNNVATTVGNGYPTFQNPNSTFTYSSMQNNLNPAANNQRSMFDEPNVALSMQHLLSRQSTNTELPVFNGKPEEWPIFISAYQSTSLACGFTNLDNIRRLEKSLRGPARSIVEVLLCNPDFVPLIMKTLQEHFGKPEFLINAHLNRIKKEPGPNSRDLQTYVRFSVFVRNLCAAIESSGLQQHINNPTMLQELVNRLPNNLAMRWGNMKRRYPDANIITFSNWLDDMSADICSVLPHAISFDQPSTSDKKSVGKDKGNLNLHDEDTESSTDINTCDLCHRSKKVCRNLTKCTAFPKLSLDERWKVVRKMSPSICFICLKSHSGECKMAKDCGVNGCRKRHNPALHNPKLDPKKDSNGKSENGKADSKAKEPKATHSRNNQAETNNHQASSNQTIFRLVPVTLKGREKDVETYAFFDDGSSLSLMNQSLADELGLAGVSSPLHLKWTGGSHRTEEDSRQLTVKIAASGEGQPAYNLSVRTVSDLALSPQSLNVKVLRQKFKHLQTVPIAPYQNVKPGLLIGADHPNLCLAEDYREGNDREPVATKTKLGWCIYGRPYPRSNKPSETVGHHYHICECQKAEDSRVEDLIRSYYSLESMGVDRKEAHILTADEKRAYEIMEKTTTKKGDRYEVGLLWKYSSMRLPDSYRMALSRLKCLEKKLATDTVLKEKTFEILQDYKEKGYIRELTADELKVEPLNVWYLPVFLILNPNKPGKVRPVWDAAAVVDGISLNHVLLTGPDLVPLLLHILLRFRERKIAFTGDIEQMFHRVRIRKEDQNAQRFLWRDCNPNVKPKIYVMTVMTFGATCSPFQSQYVKNINADQYAPQYPRAARSIKENTYVDDNLESVDTVGEALQLANDIKTVNSKAGFNIRNWKTNVPELTAKLNGTTNSETVHQISVPDGNVEKILGMFWECTSDSITYSLRFNKTNKDILTGIRNPTKRDTLRTLMSIFDPPGYLSHYLVGLKLIQRDCWLEKIGWDEVVPEPILEKWMSWIKYLPDIETLKIPRMYLQLNDSWDNCVADLHVFVDAGERAMAAVAYLRIETPNGVDVALIASKTKSNPLQITAMPRLELMAAVIGCRLAVTIKKALTIPLRRTFLCSDSTTVLSWLATSRKLIQFVAFRVGEIRENSNLSDWNWVPTKENVADEATKYQANFDLSIGSRWFRGPDFLYKDPEQWPTKELSDCPTHDLNLHHEYYINHHEEQIQPIIDTERFSTWRKLVRSLAYAIRFTSLIRANKDERNDFKGALTQEELQRSEAIILKEAQAESFPDDLRSLRTNKKLTRKNKLYKHSPAFDDNGILRIDGRIAASTANFETKFPIILAGKHKVTRLIVEEKHRKFCHQFNESVVNELRQKYNIDGLRKLIKNIQNSCVTCKIRNAKPQVPIMAPLPKARLADHCRPFTYTGVDLCGPFFVTVRRKLEKRWIVLYTCLTVRAIHMEVTESLSTDSFIMTFRNFTNRRGEPCEMYSDRGTNFVGAAKELRQALKDVDFNKVMERTTTSTLKWSFNPPKAAHYGGSWERMFRSVKSGLSVMLPPERHPTPEIFNSALIEIEGIINSRPLTYMPLDDENAEALTPNHFLLGSSSGTKVLGTPTDEPKALKKTWQRCQQIAQRFWKRWTLEYLPELTRRTKWYEDQDNLSEDDIVIMVDEKDTNRSWPRGRVVKVIKSSDAKIRKAVIKTVDGIYERPVAKLARLDIRNISGGSFPRGRVLVPTDQQR